MPPCGRDLVPRRVLRRGGSLPAAPLVHVPSGPLKLCLRRIRKLRAHRHGPCRRLPVPGSQLGARSPLDRLGERCSLVARRLAAGAPSAMRYSAHQRRASTQSRRSSQPPLGLAGAACCLARFRRAQTPRISPAVAFISPGVRALRSSPSPSFQCINRSAPPIVSDHSDSERTVAGLPEGHGIDVQRMKVIIIVRALLEGLHRFPGFMQRSSHRFRPSPRTSATIGRQATP